MADGDARRSSLSIEDQALLCAARPALTVERQQRLSRFVASPLNWLDLAEQAEWHGIAPLLYRHICSMSKPAIPRDALDALAQCSRDCLAWNLRLHHELVRLLGLFNEADLPVMPLKGLYLGCLLYDDPALRSTSDLDLLVQPAHLPASERLLEQAGLVRLPEDRQGADYHVSYATGGEGSVVIELHTGLGEEYVAGLDVRAIWASASPVTWEDRRIWTMTHSDLLLYLCLHAVKDGLASLRSLLDITLFLERFGGNLPWDEIAHRVDAVRVKRPIYMCLYQCRELLGASVPAQFLDAIRPRAMPSWLLGQTLFQWRGGVLHAAPALLTGPVMALQMLLWEDSLRGKFRHLRRNLFPSARLRARWTSLSTSSSPVHWYPAWMWAGCRHLSHQLATRLQSRHAGPPPS